MKSWSCYIGLLFYIVHVSDGKLNCPASWTSLRRGCYKFVTTKMTWTNAQMNCNMEGGDLVSIVSFTEKRRIQRQLIKIITSPDHSDWWVGLSLDRRQGRWSWQDGTPLQLRVIDWTPGEPNNKGSSEDCAELSFKGTLNDMNCNMKKPFICERIEITPPPSRSTVAISNTTLMTTATKPTTAKPTTMGVPETTALSEKDTTTVKSKVTNPHTSSDKDSSRAPSTGSSSTQEPPVKIRSTAAPSKTTVMIVQSSSMDRSSSTGMTVKQWTTGKPNRQTHCPSITVYDIEWPKTVGGVLVSRPCQSGNGQATWHCGKSPLEWLGEPDVSNCASITFTELIGSIDKLTSNNKNLTAEVATEITTKLSERTSTVKHKMSSADIAVSTNILRQASKARPKNAKQATQLIESFTSAGSNIMKQTKLSEVIGKGDKSRSASNLLETMEEATKAMVEALDQPTTIVKKEDKLSLMVQVVNSSTTKSIKYDDEEAENSFSIPVLKSISRNGLARAIFMTYYDIEDLLPAGELVSGSEIRKEEGSREVKLEVASNIISASLGMQNTADLPEPVNFTIKLNQIANEVTTPLCSFWDFNKGEYGMWSQKGCSHTGSNSTHVSCQCNHLTNFAILLDVTGVQLMYHHSILLQYITFIGCIISIVSLFTSWLTFQCLSSLQNERNSIHKNLVFCLFAAEIIFLIGINRTEQQVACAAIALLLHFFFLSAFMWMLIEGIHITVMLVQVFDTAQSRLKYYYLFGYGVPVVIVAATATVDFTAYGTRQFCWLTTDDWFIWSFAGPVAVVLLVNACVLAYSMSMVCRHADYVFSRDPSGTPNFRAWIQGALAIEVLLGLTWVFGYMYINQETIAMAYIFTALNSLQGLFIFVFHCLLNKKVRNEYKKLIHLSKKSQSSMKSSSVKKQTGSTSYEMYVPANS